MTTEASLSDLRHAIEDLFHPQRLVVRRGHAGSVDLRVLADDFADAEDSLGLLNERLGQRDLHLPARTLTLLKSPDDLEDDDEQRLFSQRLIGTPNWADALMLEPQTPEPDDRGLPAGVKTIAFWGLKGGVGRSTALAHVALLLGQRQVKVLAVDLDLESPALVGAMTGYSGGVARFEELVRMAADPSLSDEDLEREVQRALLPATGAGNLVEVLGPSNADIPFVHALLGPLSPSVLYSGARPPLRRLLRAAVRASGAEIVLLDARSGYCDESAVAVLDLADEVVLFASPAPSTYPSLEPAVVALERSRRARGRPGSIHFVAGMLPAGDDARSNCIEELAFQLELARLGIAEALATPPDALPPEASFVAIDYSARIVENEGGLQVSGLGEGYRELAERILPPPMPLSFRQIDEGWAAKVIREAQIPVPQAESEPNSKVLADLFTRASGLDRLFRHDTCLVLGAKGTGKSYLRRICLEQPDLIGQRLKVPSWRIPLFVEGYASPRDGRGAMPQASQTLLRELDKRFADRWNEVWSMLALGRCAAVLDREWSLVGTPTSSFVRTQEGSLRATTIKWVPPDRALLQFLNDLVAADGEQAVLEAISAQLSKGQSLLISDAWRAMAAWCEREGKQVTLLFDDLDVALGESAQAITRRRGMIVGLLDQANASWTSSRHLGVKIFLRKDIFDGLATEEQAKYQQRQVTLNWLADDIGRLIVRAMAAASLTFQTHIEGQGIRIDNLEETPKEDWEGALALIWGERLGTGTSNTRSTVWVEKQLRDGNGCLYPRAALWLLDSAVRSRKSERIDTPPLLDPRSLRDAIPDVSEGRLSELMTESGQEQRSRIERLAGFKSYQDRKDFLNALERAGESDPAAALKTLEDLGIVETGARRDKTPTVRIVDLYAFAPRLRIERLGRR
jgi:cellulose biosynthesis protein BcsQ